MFGQILQRMDDAIVACDPSAALNTIIDRVEAEIRQIISGR